jgi:hypothetical protein
MQPQETEKGGPAAAGVCLVAGAVRLLAFRHQHPVGGCEADRLLEFFFI